MNQILRKIPANYRPYVLPGIVLILIIALSLTLGKYMFSNIMEAKGQLDTLKSENAALQAKVQVLQSLDQTKLSSELENIVNAIPTKSSTLPALASVRSFAFQRGLDISSFSVKNAAQGKSSAKSVQLDLTVTGPQENIVSYLADLKSASPLMQVTGVEIANANESTRATISLLSFWGTLPTTLGKSDTPIEPIKSSEQSRINDLQNLKVATGGALVPSAPQGKENPFTF